ncbi:MAG TPA: hypothetical protein PLP29_14960 [Candidatus Ozemobacteraceae bacterium]|nr:hypothetical protein [Candidatus Ozemobacteraceae bacterium]
MRRSSCLALLCVLALSGGVPAVAGEPADIHAITQRITELRNKLDAFRGVQPAAPAEAASNDKAAQSAGAAAKGLTVGKAASAEAAKPASLDGEKLVLLPPTDEPAANASPEGESSAIEHRQDVKLTVLFHDDAAPTTSRSPGTGKPTNSTSRR